MDECIGLADMCPIVLDIYYHYIKTGEYITPDDPRIEAVVNSWRSVLPVIHYSISREDIISGHRADDKPDLELLLESGLNKQKLRAHSDFYWNDAVNDWALSHSVWADIMCESKGKNLASFMLYEYAKK